MEENKNKEEVTTGTGNQILLGLIALGTTVGLFLYNILSWGFVVFKFYQWFILPIFKTLPEITFTQSVGIMLFMRLFGAMADNNVKLTIRNSTDTTESNTEAFKANINGVLDLINPWFILSIGYISFVYIVA